MVAQPHLETASGQTITITNGFPAPLKACSVTINPVQSGTGDPNPENIRPIIGRTGLSVYVSPISSGGTEYSVSWTDYGTVYGGTLDVTNGTLSVETVYREFDGSSDEAWEETGASGTTSQVFLLPWADVRGATFDGKTIICNQALETDLSGDPAYGFCKNAGAYYNIRMNIMKTAVLLTEFRAYLSQHPLQIVCPLVTPQTYQLTPQQISTIRGENHIWSDAGNVSATYYTI